MNMITCLIIGVVMFLSILIFCKWKNFSIIPKELKVSSPGKFKFPKVRRDSYNKWEVDYSESDSDYSDSESEDFSSSDEDSNYSSDEYSD